LFFGHLESHPSELPETNGDMFADRFVAALSVPDQWPAPGLEMRAVTTPVAIVLEQIHEVLRTIIDVRTHEIPPEFSGDLFAFTRRIRL
jgi:hypothetical protein